MKYLVFISLLSFFFILQIFTLFHIMSLFIILMFCGYNGKSVVMFICFYSDVFSDVIFSLLSFCNCEDCTAENYSEKASRFGR